MTAERARTIAKLVDGAVISVHRRVGPAHGEQIRLELKKIGLTSAGLLLDMAEFLLADSFSYEAMRLRFRYHNPDDLKNAIETWQNSGAVGPDLRASPELQGFLRLILDLRAEVARALWLGHEDDFPSAAQGARAVIASSAGALLSVFRALPVPDQDALAVHHLLTGVRYHRADAHALAWERAGLQREEIGPLTNAWHGKPIEPPMSLVERGWFDADGLTALGRETRDEIEAATNQRAAAAFAGFDNKSWLTWFNSVKSLATAEASHA